ncbi:hypothetical protein IH992_34320, partial [Candidatus Poribacteria bacterium]|nr:hypothetical protein [Candidatus Poribacteria bacterium]
MNASEVQIGAQSGELIVDGRPVRMVDWQHRPIYDTLELAAAAIAVGDNFIFTNLGTKDLRLTNLSQSGQLPSDWEMIIKAIMIQVTPNDLWANLTVDNLFADIHNLHQALYFELVVGQTTLVTQGRLEDYPYPFGKNVVATVSQDNIAAASTIDYVSVNNGAIHGTPRRLDTPIHITPDL